MPKLFTATSDSKRDPASRADFLPNLPDHIQNLLNSKHPYTDKGRLFKGKIVNKKASANLDSSADQSEHQKGPITQCQTIEVSRRPTVAKVLNLMRSITS